MTNEERKKVYLDAWIEANNTPGGRDAHVEGLRAVYDAGLTRAAEIARAEIGEWIDEWQPNAQMKPIEDCVAAAIDAEKEKK